MQKGLIPHLALGLERVVVLCDAYGIDSKGVPLQMPLAEAFKVGNGKVAEIRPFQWDMVMLRKVGGVD